MILWSANLIVFGFVIFCTAQDPYNERNKRIQDIIDKVYNISSDAIAIDPSERVNILNNIEKRLKESSLNFGGKSDRYVHIIMHGVKAMLANENIIKDSRKYGTHGDFQPLFDVLNTVTETDIRKSNRHLVDKIASKMVDIANKYMKDAQTQEEKESIIKIIRIKVLDMASKQTNATKGKKKVYASLLKLALQKMAKKISQTKGRRRTENIHDESYKRYFEKRKPGYVNFVAKTDKILNEETTTPLTEYASTTFKSCGVTLRETCEDIKALRQYECSGKVLSLEKLCDGIVDCHDKSDEEYCLDQAMVRIHKVTRIMAHLETYILEKCFLNSDNTILVKQKVVLEDVLHTQSSLLDRFTGLNSTKDLKEVKIISNQAVSVLETIGIALNGALCMSEPADRNKMNAQRDLKVFDDDIIDRKVPLEQCNCRNSFCADQPCPESCKLVCWYKHSLARWSCHAIDETTSISLNKICDGKIDCYDESDEVGCTSGSQINKFEANAIYDKVLKMIELKAKSKEYSLVYKKLMLFYNHVKLLQKTIFTVNIAQERVRDIRDQCFSTLLSIYEDILKRSKSVGDLDDVQMFLQLANENLIAALKRSYLVQNKIVPQSGCQCRNSKCIVQNCPKQCERACKVRPQLTKYQCKGSMSNMSIPTEWICNNRQDCPFEDDEGQCKWEICRKPHLKVVQNSLRYIGEDKKGTALGEILKDWGKKAIATLTSAEKEFKLTHTIYRDLIEDILNDLVMTYAFTEESSYRRNINTNKTYFDSFWQVSQKVIGYLRLCNH